MRFEKNGEAFFISRTAKLKSLSKADKENGGEALT